MHVAVGGVVLGVNTEYNSSQYNVREGAASRGVRRRGEGEGAVGEDAAPAL